VYLRECNTNSPESFKCVLSLLCAWSKELTRRALPSGPVKTRNEVLCARRICSLGNAKPLEVGRCYDTRAMSKRDAMTGRHVWQALVLVLLAALTVSGKAECQFIGGADSRTWRLGATKNGVLSTTTVDH